MNNEILQRMVENLRKKKFGPYPFKHRPYFNKRVHTTGGRYLLNLMIMKLIQNNMSIMEDAVVKIILHELCHYPCILLVRVINIKIKILND